VECLCCLSITVVSSLTGKDAAYIHADRFTRFLAIGLFDRRVQERQDRVTDFMKSVGDNTEDMPRARILYVEDHADTCEVICRLLRAAGYETSRAPTAQDARVLCADAEFDLVIMDIGLPDGDGCALFMEIVHRCHGRGIAFSGFTDEAMMQRITAANFAAHLLKPIQFDKLHDAIKSVLSPLHLRVSRDHFQSDAFSP
jgi:CheY-like chemotaxis protein